MTSIIAGMRVAGGTGEGVQVEGGAGVRGAGVRAFNVFFYDNQLCFQNSFYSPIKYTINKS